MNTEDMIILAKTAKKELNFANEQPDLTISTIK